MAEPVSVGGVGVVVVRVLVDMSVVARERTIRTSIVGIGAVGSWHFLPWPIGSRTARKPFVRDLTAVMGMTFFLFFVLDLI